MLRDYQPALRAFTGRKSRLSRSQIGVSGVLAIVCVAVFGLTSLTDLLHVLSRPEAFGLLGLSYYGVVQRMWLFQFLTHPFLHGNLAHLFFNMLTLWTLGRRVEQALGTARYLLLTAISACSGAVAFLFVDWGGTSVAIGYSSIIFGLLTAEALLHPEDHIIVVLFSMKIKHAVVLLSAVEMYLAVFSEAGGLANIAHLFGALGAFIYLRGPQWCRWAASIRKSTAKPCSTQARHWTRVPYEL